MTAKQFSILILTIVLCSVLFAFAQTSTVPIMLNAQTSLAGCTWPTAYATVSNGVALCPLNLSGQPGLAIAINGGAFVQIPMTQGGSSPYTATLPVVVTGQVISCPTCVTGPVVTSFNTRFGDVKLVDADVTGTGLKVVTTVTSTAVSTPQ